MNVTFLLTIIIIVFNEKSTAYHKLLQDYRDYDSMQKYLHAIATQYSPIVTLYSIGKSYLGKNLWVALVTSSLKEDVGIPNVKVIGTVHGNEPITQEVILHFLHHLVTGWSNGDENIKNLLRTTKIHLLPNLNPDGSEECINWYKQNNMSECEYEPPGRRNYKGVDLDTNFKMERKGNSPSILKPEVIAIKEWMREYHFVTSLSLHSGRLVAYYPYDSYYDDAVSIDDSVLTKENEIFRKMALTYSINHPLMHKGLPCPTSQKSFENGIINGAALSPYRGSMQDYNYRVHSTMEITVSISCCKFPNANEIQSIYQSNQKSLLEWVSQVDRGIKGKVIDFDTRTGVDNAIFTICNSNITFYASKTGEFWKILRSGYYLIMIKAKGYKDTSFDLVIKDNDASAIWFDIIMHSNLNDNNDTGNLCDNLERRATRYTKYYIKMEIEMENITEIISNVNVTSSQYDYENINIIPQESISSSSSKHYFLYTNSILLIYIISLY